MLWFLFCFENLSISMPSRPSKVSPRRTGPERENLASKKKKESCVIGRHIISGYWIVMILCFFICKTKRISPMAQRVKNLLAMQETQEMWARSLGWEDLLEKEMATHSSILAWKIPWTEVPGRLQSKSLKGHKELDLTEWLSMDA